MRHVFLIQRLMDSGLAKVLSEFILKSVKKISIFSGTVQLNLQLSVSNEVLEGENWKNEESVGWTASRKRLKKSLSKISNEKNVFLPEKAQFGSQICFGVDFEKSKKLDLEHLYLLLGSSFLMVINSPFYICFTYLRHTTTSAPTKR